MKSITRRTAAGGLALALTLLVALPAAADPEAARNEGCLGETFHVSIEQHIHVSSRTSPAGQVLPLGGSYGALGITNMDLSVTGTFVRELRDGKLRWVSRIIDWKGESSGLVVGCNSRSCDAGGHLELGPWDGGAEAMSREQEDQMQWRCKPEKVFGICFPFTASHPTGRVPFPNIRGTRDTLRSGRYYMTVDKDGTRYSEWVEQRGNEQVSISAEPREIPPNKGPNKQGKPPDDPTSQLTVKATCNGVPLGKRRLGLRIDVMPRSGGHIHLEKRPRGNLVWKDKNIDCGVETGALADSGEDTACITVETEANGEAKVKFESPLTGEDSARYGTYKIGIAGDYKITAKDAQITEVRAQTIVYAKVQGLQRATFDGNLTHSDPSPKHPEAFWGTKGTLSAFTKLAEDFNKYQTLHNVALKGCGKTGWPVQKLSMNDIALPTGGVFDWHQTWRPSHQTHNKGEGGDINHPWVDYDKTGVECGPPSDPRRDGDTVHLYDWYIQVLLDLAKKYGHWDCADLAGSLRLGPTQPVRKIYDLSSYACDKGEIPEVGEVINPLPPGYAGPPNSYFPPDLHLHVED